MDCDFWLTHWKFLSAPILGGLIGWVTNWLAVKMLFHPHRAVNCGFFSLQGVIPFRQKALAKSVGDAIEKNLINHDDLRNVLLSPKFQQFCHDTVAGKVGGLLDKVAAENQMIAMIFIAPGLREKIIARMMQELDTAVPELLATTADKLPEHLNFGDIVREKIEKFDVALFEQILIGVIQKELRFIVYVGGVLGFLIGVAQAAIFYFA